jgi:hypothetical protein
MTHIWQGLRSGQWLTSARVRGYSLILLGLCAAAMAGWIVASDGLIDRNGKPLGTDFSNVYAAGNLTLSGRPAEACSQRPMCSTTTSSQRRSRSRFLRAMD